jgi:UDP-N-acetyl-2-amino-2-deoxyglucuronate dehydrogenase
MPDPVRFAILGTGMVAAYHRQAIEANADLGAELAAVVHYDPNRFDALSAQFGVPCLTEEAMLARGDIDAVCICTPSGQHAAQGVAAAQAGKHVLVEKPMALTLADADRMIAACQEAGVQLGVLYQRRSDPVFQKVHRAIREGDLGALTLGTVTMPYFRGPAYYDQAAWRGTWALDGGGVLMNQGIHLIDLLVWYMGDPVAVEAFGGTLHRDVEVEDVLGGLFRFENGSVATVAATTTAAPGFPHRLGFYGTGGGIEIEGETTVRWTLASPEKARIAPPELQPSAGAGSGGDPRGIAATGHARLVRDFIGAIHAPRAPVVDGHQGRRSLAAVLALYQAAGLDTAPPSGTT